jgi:hypothetical protein
MPFAWLSALSRKLARPASRSQRRTQLKFRQTPQLETLEAREVPAHLAHPDYVVKLSPHTAKPDGGSAPSSGAYTPAEISSVYGFNQVSFNGTAGTGAGTTIAIVDAYSDPNITSDVAGFDKQFNLPTANITVVNETGGTKLPAGNTGWAGEISLDVEWAHAVAPGASILLVESNSASYSDLFTAVRYAAAQKGVVAVSMSWGGSEFSGETAYDSSTFTPPASNPDVVFVNSSGDSGAPASYPSTSPNVLSVGGTTLNSGLSPSGTYTTESAWDDSGGGISAYESQPSYQKGVVTQSTTKRTSPDVAYDADPNTGFPVYQTYGNSGGPWLQYGGTSDAAPQWAALIAITDQGRALDGEAALTNNSLLSSLYKAPAADFHDVTTGTTDGSPHESAGPGYDLTTGLGTPVANLLISTLEGTPTNAVTHYAVVAPATAAAGVPFTVTVEALNANNQEVATYTGTTHFTSNDTAASLPPNYVFTSSDAGAHTFTNGVTLNTPGTEIITVTDASNSSITGSATVTVSAPYFTVTSIPTTVNAGVAEPITITAYNANGTLNSSYSGTVTLKSTDPNAAFSANPITVTGGKGTGTVTFATTGVQSVTATAGSVTGTESGITVYPGGAAKLVFLQEPSNVTVGGVISPAIVVEELDQYGNVVTTDNASTITLSLGTNPGGATIGGTVTEKVVAGVATFSTITVSAAGTGDTLVATEGSLSVTSTAFNVSNSSGNVIENFQNGLNNYYYVGYSYPYVMTTTAAAHPGTATYGLLDEGDGNWYFREDSGAYINPGDTVSAWVNFDGNANGRAYFGFGTNNNGLDSVVLAPNTNQFIIQNNSGFESFTNLAATAQTYSANAWYLVQVQWGASGKVIANLYGSNGSLLNSVTAATGATTAGPFAFRATGSTKYFSTVTDTPGGNNFSLTAPTGKNAHKKSDLAAVTALQDEKQNGLGSVSTRATGNSLFSSWNVASAESAYLWYAPTTFSTSSSYSSQLWYAPSEQFQLSEEFGVFFN